MSARTWWRSAAGVALVFGVTLAAYAPAMTAGFIWDDDTMLTRNPLVKAPDGLRRFWFTTQAHDYFPLTYSALWLQWRLWGMHPAGYHLVNVLLHAVSAVLLWRVLAGLKVPGAWLAGLIFAVHPVNAESVAWITEVKNALPMVFYLLSAHLYLRFDARPARGLYAGSLGAFAAALLAKTSVVTLPVVLLGCLWWRRGKIALTDLLRALPFFFLAGVLGAVTVWFQYHRAIGQEVVRTDGLLSRLVIASWAVWFYLYKAILPVNLCFVYPRWTADASAVWSYLPLAGLAVAAVILWRYRRTWGRSALFGLGYFVVTLLPVLGFFNIYFMRYSLVADHWQYTSIVGVIALLAGVGAWLAGRRAGWPGKAAPVAGALVVVLLGLLTWRQARTYHSDETLWRDVLNREPDCWLAQDRMGIVLAEQGRVVEAAKWFRLAVRTKPDHHEGHYLLANALVSPEMLDVKEAVAEYRQALRLKPAYVDALIGLAWVQATCPQDQFRNGREAVALAENAVRLTGERSLAALTVLAAACAEDRQFDRAVEVARRALKLAQEQGNAWAAEAIRDQLELYYRHGVPYREPALASTRP